LAPLVDVFLLYMIRHREKYFARTDSLSNSAIIYPLPRAICRILYVFCKVRGVKVISRFFNNEPKFLELMVRAFTEWDEIDANETVERSEQVAPLRLVWEERYVMLMWLSHLLLAPFDLASISSDSIHIPCDNLPVLDSLPPGTPKIARCILSISLHYIVSSGKEREAATTLLARLALRPDMQRLGLLRIINCFVFSLMAPQPEVESSSIYASIGVLSFLARLGTSSRVEDLAPVAMSIFGQAIRVTQGESKAFEAVRSSALARKMIVKVLRSIAVLALSTDKREHNGIHGYEVSTILEDSIDSFLVSLADKETQVRLAASKALSIVTVKLDPDMATEVIEAVIDSLNENVLYQKPDGALVTFLEARTLSVTSLRRNLSAVDPQRWQGLVLTLAHLLFRRAPPPRQLQEILQSLISGLDFEQRSSTGSSVGTGVRDASCFGIWALSRKYTTKELLALELPGINSRSETPMSVIQMLAIELVCTACVDPAGNIRRGASAALQELIGRHPDTILESIPLVQVVDYHAVARRSRAMVDVSKRAAALGGIYWDALINSLLSWRGIGSPDAESRRGAAIALGELCLQDTYITIKNVLERLHEKLSNIPPNDVETKHGCLLAIAATVDAFVRHGFHDNPRASEAITQVSSLWEIFDSPYGPSKDELTLQAARPQLSAEGWARFISSLSQAAIEDAEMLYNPRSTRFSQPLLDRVLDVLLLCVSRNEDVSIEASSEAASNLFLLLPLNKQEETIREWFNNIHASWKLGTGRGQISSLGAVFRRLPSNSDARKFIGEELLRCTSEEEMIEKRISAVKCLRTGVLPHIGVPQHHHFAFSEYTNLSSFRSFG
jgi:tubulin-specific chaperone D